MVQWYDLRGFLAQLTLFFLVTGMAGTIDLPSFRKQLMNARGVGTGLFCQFALLPFVGFCSVKMAGLGYLDGVMLLLTTTSPGGGFSGFWCSLCNASVALSVAMTTVSTLMSIVILPFNMFLYLRLAYGASAELNFVSLGLSICIVVGAVAFGLLLGSCFPKQRNVINKLGSLAGLVNIMLALSPSGFSSAPGDPLPPELIPQRGLAWFLAVCAPCIVGLAASFIFARMLAIDNPEAVSICIECCYQNTGLAITVALTVFTPAESEVAKVVPLIYGAAEILTIAIFGALAWKRGWTYAVPSLPFMECILGNHQPSGNYQHDAKPSNDIEQRQGIGAMD